MEIVTARLKLVIPCRSARAELARIEALPEVARNLCCGDEPAAPDAAEMGVTTFAVALRYAYPLTVVGALELRNGALTYFLSPDVWGRGYAKEAVSAICTEADRRGGELAATVIRGNWPSMRVLEANGFDFMGLHMSSARRSASYLLAYKRRPGADMEIPSLARRVIKPSEKDIP